MSWMLRIMANLMRPDEPGPAEVAYRAMATLARLVPEDPTTATGAPVSGRAVRPICPRWPRCGRAWRCRRS